MVPRRERHLNKQVFHLGVLGPEAFDLLVDAWVFLQLIQRGPFTVHVRAVRTHTHTHRHLMLASDQVERQVSYPGVNRLDIRYEVTDKDASSIHKN